jgi:hypothetical protein
MMFFGIASIDQDNTASNRFTHQPGIFDESLNQSSIPILTSAEIGSQSQSIVQSNNNVTPTNNSTHARNREPILNDRAMPLKPDENTIEIIETYKDIFQPIEKSKTHDKNFYSLSAKNNNFSTVDIKNTFLGRILNDFSISLKTFNGASFPSFDVSRYNEPIVNNFSIGINYKINKNHYIGLAYGQENFLMQFDQQEGEIIYTYNQSFNSNWVAGTYKYAFPQIANSGVFPEINILAGATQVGPIVKLGSGVGYLVADNFMFNVGVEYSLLSYPTHGDWSGGKWYYTHKLGYNFGIGVNF